jgi:hypothetical protein
MPEAKRSRVLTVFAFLLVLLAVEDFLKPFRPGPAATHPFGVRVQSGIVFFGTRPEGALAYVAGWLVATFLICLAIGIWQMRGFARAMASCYAVYVLLNILIFNLRHPPETHAELIFAVAYAVVAVGSACALAILLRSATVRSDRTARSRDQHLFADRPS